MLPNDDLDIDGISVHEISVKENSGVEQLFDEVI